MRLRSNIAGVGSLPSPVGFGLGLTLRSGSPQYGPLEGLAATRQQMLEWIASLTDSHTPGDWVTLDGRVIGAFTADRAAA